MHKVVQKRHAVRMMVSICFDLHAAYTACIHYSALQHGGRSTVQQYTLYYHIRERKKEEEKQGVDKRVWIAKPTVR